MFEDGTYAEDVHGGARAGSDAEATGLLELVMTHLRPAALQWALSTWSRSAASIGRAASAAALLEGKWAMMKAQEIEDAHREQIVRGVLRWWRSADLARVWSQWRTTAAVLPQLTPQSGAAASPHVHVRLT